MTTLKSPYPFFGGKSKIAFEIWQRFGNVPNYVEPFFGSGAVLLARPNWRPDSNRIETVNDLSGFISNFWRAVAADPEAVAHHADWPVSEPDLHARHVWLLHRKEELSARLEGGPDWYDAKIAGWWCWGMSCWIGGGFCSGQGPWGWAEDEDGNTVLAKTDDGGINRKRVHLGNAGMGVNRQLVHLGAGRGVNRQLVHLNHQGQGVTSASAGNTGITDWMFALSKRFARVRVCCGDWSRVMGPTVTENNGLTAIFLDPPYSAEAGRDNNLYEQESLTVAHDVRRWCLKNGDNPMLRLALCGYRGEGYEELEHHGWTTHAWKAHGGYGSQGNGSGRDNAEREMIWFSPACLKVKSQMSLFDPEPLRPVGEALAHTIFDVKSTK